MAIGRRNKAGAAILALAVLLGTASACGRAAPQSPESGETSQTQNIQEQPGDAEAGEVSAEEIAAYFEAFQRAAAAGEQETVAELFRYPRQLQIPGREPMYVHTAEEFLPYYDQVFTPEFLEEVAGMEPEAFVREGSAINWGDGADWARADCGELTLASVFASREDRYLAYYEGGDNAGAEGSLSPAL